MVHEAAHAIGGGEPEAYLAETEFALEINRNMARKSFIVCDEDGNYVLDKSAIDKFIEERYGGWYAPDPLTEYKKNPDGTRVIEYGRETIIEIDSM